MPLVTGGSTSPIHSSGSDEQSSNIPHLSLAAQIAVNATKLSPVMDLALVTLPPQALASLCDNFLLDRQIRTFQKAVENVVKELRVPKINPTSCSVYMTSSPIPIKSPTLKWHGCRIVCRPLPTQTSTPSIQSPNAVNSLWMDFTLGPDQSLLSHKVLSLRNGIGDEIPIKMVKLVCGGVLGASEGVAWPIPIPDYCRIEWKDKTKPPTITKLWWEDLGSFLEQVTWVGVLFGAI
ncbi:hypothetical protein BDD12DRAFT_396110 [Trichophaea hybrida]|nr:hypothetical protein BDD12DRAFT_396110 [Trichophaea hybrida]